MNTTRDKKRLRVWKMQRQKVRKFVLNQKLNYMKIYFGGYEKYRIQKKIFINRNYIRYS